MEILHILETLRRLRLLVLAGALVAVAAAILVLYQYSPPLNLTPRAIEYGAAETQILVDTAQSPLTDVLSDVSPLAYRAQIYAQLVESPPVADVVARSAGVPVDQLVLSSFVATEGTRTSRESLAEQRANEIRGEGMPDRLLFSAGGDLPVISVYAQARTGARAVQLADGGAKGLMQYLETLAENTPPARRATFRQLGPAEGATVNPGASRQVAVLAFVAIFGAWCVALLLLSNVVGAYRSAKAAARRDAAAGMETYPHEVQDAHAYDDGLEVLPVGRAAGRRS